MIESGETLRYNSFERMEFHMKKQLSSAREQYFWKLFHEICTHSRFDESKQNIQHGCTSVYQHSLSVAYLSCLIAENLSISVDWHDLIRGALLHDYFLYDWHDSSHQHPRPHGFTHPESAYRNAAKEFTLSLKEITIIKRHMFPLTPIPPTCREAWIVCLADKYLSLFETLFPERVRAKISTETENT